uniref:Uncharacterized protein n=1 Tax=Solanum lycopersicum TaxID=4081 RepID=A0A3Q7GHC1_SOLLC
MAAVPLRPPDDPPFLELFGHSILIEYKEENAIRPHRSSQSIRCTGLYVLASLFCEKLDQREKVFARSQKEGYHFIRQANDLCFAGTTKTTISLFPFFGDTFFSPRDGVGDSREQLLGQLRRKCWNLIGKDKDRRIDKGNRDDDRDHTEKHMNSVWVQLLFERNAKLYNRTNTTALIESFKIKSFYQSASLISQDISFQ